MFRTRYYFYVWYLYGYFPVSISSDSNIISLSCCFSSPVFPDPRLNLPEGSLVVFPVQYSPLLVTIPELRSGRVTLPPGLGTRRRRIPSPPSETSPLTDFKTLLIEKLGILTLVDLAKCDTISLA